MSPPTAPLLAPYTASPFPAQSLTLITSVLGATSNWLVLRILHDALLNSGNGVCEDEPGFDTGREARRGKRRVVLVSFIRGWEFWRGEARRLGLDLARLSNERSFNFVDGVSEFFSASIPSPPAISSASTISSRAPLHPPQHVWGPLPTTCPTTTTSLHKSSSSSSGTRKLRWSSRSNAGLDALEYEIASAIDDLTSTSSSDEQPMENEILLVVDQPDLLLAATGPRMGVGAVEMGEFLLGLRQRVHSTVVTLAADSPLIHTEFSGSVQQQSTPLETEHASLVVGVAHQARVVMQLRGLDTGVALDVSGVLRISKGGGWVPEKGEVNGHSQTGLEEREVLYFVQGDGAVRVFGRGE
ncbi:hypothetical protein PAAG_03807 [Paracoccidioides lutzii Pb01]|uniref:Elongator complex protein 6 n=1 Tax=Paracoccidioides lutzii (strain ATCC MYA-826 / Pb01) TaxID=502779 RepID=C1GZ63_PARBA|nr:hypothetical protein PAAG_03807 [Paracoccidioides lutzii Pb01]EEH41886.2 hypothetical protein PAAG_03807 [Paracoccidioides lutzii Pb01]